MLPAALNDALRDEVQRLKIETGHIPAVNGNAFNRGLPPQFSPYHQASHHFGSHQTQQQQSQAQLHMPQSTGNQTSGRPPQARFSDFNQRV